MSVTFYFDEQVLRAITKGVRLKGVDVVTTQEDGRAGADDSSLLDRAGALGRVMFTMDTDFLAIASSRQANGELFTGIVFLRQGTISYSQCIDDLAMIAAAGDLEDLANRVEYLPL